MLYSEYKRVLSSIELYQREIKEQITTALTQLDNTHKQLIDKLNLLEKELLHQQEYLKSRDYFYKLSDVNKLEISIIEGKDALGANFTLYSNFLYPSLFIGYNKELVPYLTSAEPLYIANWDKESIPSILSQFNSIYQSKIRVYHLARKNFVDLLELPLHQFSCIVCWDILKYLRLDNIGIFLNNLFKLLRPGGVLYINFPDSRNLTNLELVEQNLYTFQTAEEIKKLLPIKQIQNIEHLTTENHLDYFKITVNGKLDTVKLQPVLGEIIPKTS